MKEKKTNSGEQLFVAGAAGCLPADEYLWQSFRLRRNVLSGKVEYRKIDEDDSHYRHFTEQTLNSIILQSHRDGFTGKESISADLKLLVESDDLPLYDPVKEWLDDLKWDGKERLVDYWQRIPGVTAQQIYWLNIWLRSVVAQWLGLNKEHGNECVPTLIGSQGQGKSTFFLRMLPPQFREYFLDSIKLNNNFDKDMALTNNLLVNLDEFDKYSASQQAQIKQTLSRVRVNGRLAYGRTQEDRRRYASFTATTNSLQPLTDPSGSRRYICLLPSKGQYIDNQTPIEYEQLYAQVAYELLVKKERHWFTREEVDQIQAANAPFQAVLSIEQMVSSCVSPAGDDEAGYVTTTEVIAKVKEAFPAADDSMLTCVRVGRVLHSMGFLSKRSAHGELYRAVFKCA